MDMPMTGMPDEQMGEEKMKELMEHLKEHVTYPASKKDIMEECDMMEHVPEMDKQWMMDNLPDGMYENAGEVRETLMKSTKM